MPSTGHVLTGFDGFLERRRVAFVDPLPATRVCGSCGLVPSQSLLLPCGHVLCRICKARTLREVKCPFDGRVCAETDAVSLNFRQSDLEQLLVSCIIGDGNCGFVGKLSELKHHLTQCARDEVKCASCGQTLVRNVAACHYQECTGGMVAPQAVSKEDVESIVDGLGEIKANLERLRLRGAGEQFDRHGVVNDANCLLERVVSLERDVLFVHERASTATECWTPQVPKEVPISPGPFRAACRPGAFVILRTFVDVPAKHDAAKSAAYEVVIPTEVCVLAGYSFKLECKLAKDQRGDVQLWFVLCLCGGVWDSLLEWPFTKKVTVILTHPRFEKRDVRLAMCMKDHGVVKKPVSTAALNTGSCTEKVTWTDIELNGFIDNKSLYANVEFQ
ncbi:uncharacterized protein LOC142558487 [Dermacentor variabilis]|uniref:uncharacterized protein LOC142558487 n=1 Tax=Dermacentor variabilis TaxID=34621 RepID=UPI003F5C7D87